jgi:signal peptidase I
MDGEAMRGDRFERDEGQARPFYGFGTVDADNPDDDRPRFVDEPLRPAANPYPPPPPGYQAPQPYGSNGSHAGNGAPPVYPGNGAPPPTYGQPTYGAPAYGPSTYGQPPADHEPSGPSAGYGQPSFGQPSVGQQGFGQPSFGRSPVDQPDGDDRDTATMPRLGGGRHAAQDWPSVPDRPQAPEHPAAAARHAAPTGPSGLAPTRPPGLSPEWPGRPSAGPDREPPERERVRDYDEEPVRSRRAPSRRRRPLDGDEEADDGRRVMPLWQELPLLLVVAFCLAVLIRTFLLQAFYIPSTSMEATLLVGDRVLVNKIVYDVRQPNRGEVVVFRGPPNWAPDHSVPPAGNLFSRIGRTLGDLVGVSRPGEKDFIKRVIGLPGDRVSCCDPDGRIYVNGKGIDEPYINVNSSLDVPPSPGSCGPRRFAEVLVPPGQVFVMGDNRIVSQDSRCQGPVPIENIIGRAFVIVWPNSRWDTVSVPSTFDNVPPPVAIGDRQRNTAIGDRQRNTAIGDRQRNTAIGGARPAGAPPGPTLAFAVLTMPIVSALAVTAGSTRKRRWVRRTLPR